MVLLTMIARVNDGLPLATSVEGEGGEQHDHAMVKYTNQAKMLFRKLNAQSPAKCTLESTGNYLFHYVIKDSICCLCLCDARFPTKTAFKYLEDVANEFCAQHGTQVSSKNVTRPYHFIEFDEYIQQARRRYTDSRMNYQLNNVSNELMDTQRIMVQNIEDVIHRGEALNILDDKAANLAVLSKKYKEDARYLNLKSVYAKIGAILIIVVLVLLFLRFKFF